MQGVVLEQGLVVEVEQVKVEVVGQGVARGGLCCEGPHELRLAGAAHARDHLDVPRPLEGAKALHVFRAVYPSQRCAPQYGFET